MSLLLHMFAVGALLAYCFADGPAGGAPDGALRAADLRCEYLVDPVAIEEMHPRLSWVVASSRRAERQTAYRILVASSPERLARDEGDLWDSRRVESAQTAQVVYDGAALEARQECHWKVMVWDRDARPGPWSAAARWEMGLAPADQNALPKRTATDSGWVAKWIEAGATPAEYRVLSASYETYDGGVRKDVTARVAELLAANAAALVPTNELLGGDPAPNVRKRLIVECEIRGTRLRVEAAENARLALPPRQIPLLRKSFTLARPVRKARLYATALGAYELRLNGQRVGDQHLAPGWTDYNRRVRYQAYDVTPQLAAGANVLAATVAPGWYSGHAGLFNAVEFYGKTPALRAELEVTYDDGTTERVITDDSWRVHAGPLLGADLLKGEIYDARSELAGWDAPGFDDGAWRAASTREETRAIEPDVSQPVRIVREIPAKSVAEPAPGRWTFDLGQNMVGVARLRIAAPAGTVVTLRHAEMLNPDGTIYTANLRGADATDTYICRGGATETWQPRFTFHGFRYVELTGAPARPPIEAITGIVLASDLPSAGEFECSDARVNQLQSNIVWGLRGNYLSIPTDCPQRDERMGWMADAQVFLPTATYNADVSAFMTKWMTDVTDAQREDGAHSDVAPAMKGLSYGTPAWADAGVIVPWTIYRAYGDRRILERNAQSMIAWVEWCRANSTALIRDKARGNDYGDWLSIEADTPKDLLGTAYFAHATDLLARTLRVLGRDADAERYEQLFAQIRDAFGKHFVGDDARMMGDTQCAYVLALRFGLLPDTQRGRALDRLCNDIAAKGGHLSTGFVGVGHLLPVLADGGRSDVAYRLLMQDTFPSWLFSVRHGATTIWERWNGWTPETGVHPDAGMNSFNHYALGSCGQWLFEGVAGIRQDESSAGFERLVIRPRPHASLSWARAAYRSIRGTIRSAWKVDGAEFSLDVEIPANMVALVYVPSARGEDVRESGRSLEAAEGVRFIRQEQGATVLEAGSGTYMFTAPHGKGP